MYKRILVTVDGSANAAHALQHAAGLARGLSATLRLIHVVDMGLMPYGPELGIDIDALLEARYAASEKLLADARDSVQAPGIAVETKLVDTALPTVHVATTIAEAAASWPADLVVLDKDPLQTPPEGIPEIKVKMTLVGGRIVYDAR